MKIKTNNVPRSVMYGYELTEKERADFEHIEYIDSAEFFRFKGSAYYVGDFCRVVPHGSVRLHPTECDNPDFAGWNGYMADSFFSGMLIKWPGDEAVIVGTYSC